MVADAPNGRERIQIFFVGRFSRGRQPRRRLLLRLSDGHAGLPEIRSAGSADFREAHRGPRDRPADREPANYAAHPRLRSRRRQGPPSSAAIHRARRAEQSVVWQGSAAAGHARARGIRAMIVADHLTRRFGARVAVEDVSFEVGRSEIVALLGPNGAGKTATLRMLAGLISPSAGSVTIDGTTLATSTAAALRTRIGFLTETPGLGIVCRSGKIFGCTHLRPGRARYGHRSIVDTVRADRYTSTPAAELSKGTRQKAALARALLHDPKVLLLDDRRPGSTPKSGAASGGCWKSVAPRDARFWCPRTIWTRPNESPTASPSLIVGCSRWIARRRSGAG